MTNHDALTVLITALEQTSDHLVDAAADAIIDGEWETALNLTAATRVVDRQLQFRLDELADADDQDTYSN